MSEDKENVYLKSTVGMFEFAMRKWKLLLGIALVSGLLGVFFSGPKFIEPKFKSIALIYPTNLGEYGSETVVEQMQQYLQSNQIRNFIVDKYNLHEEYDLDPEYPKAPAYMELLYNEHVKFRLTRFQSIEISVSSTNPEKAKAMVDEIIFLLNEIIYETQRVKLKTVMLTEKQKMKSMEAKLDSLESIIKEHSVKHGILDFPNQTAELMEGYMKFLLQGKKGKDFDKVEEMFENMKKHGHKVYNLGKLMEQLNEFYAEQVAEYFEALAIYNRKMEYTYVLVAPEVSTLKASPIRWLIALFAMFSAVLFTFVLLLIFGHKKNK